MCQTCHFLSKFLTFRHFQPILLINFILEKRGFPLRLTTFFFFLSEIFSKSFFILSAFRNHSVLIVHFGLFLEINTFFTFMLWTISFFEAFELVLGWLLENYILNLIFKELRICYWDSQLSNIHFLKNVLFLTYCGSHLSKQSG